MNTVFLIAMIVMLLAVLTTLFIGLYALFRGGEFGRAYSNKLMRLRVLLQFVTILVVLAAVAYWRWQVS